MDYNKMAEEFLENMRSLRKFKPNEIINESMQGECIVFYYIASQQGPIIPSEISENLQVSSARITATLNSLEKKGYITRKIDSHDRRRVIIELTPKGKEESDMHKKILLNVVSSMFISLGEKDAKEYLRITGRLAELAQDME